jgi:hypothetical protein
MVEQFFIGHTFVINGIPFFHVLQYFNGGRRDIFYIHIRGIHVPTICFNYQVI